MLPRLAVEPSLAGFKEQVTQKTAWNNLDTDSALFLQESSIFQLNMVQQFRLPQAMSL